MANKWKILAWDSKDSNWIIQVSGINSESEAKHKLKQVVQATGWKCKIEKY